MDLILCFFSIGMGVFIQSMLDKLIANTGATKYKWFYDTISVAFTSIMMIFIFSLLMRMKQMGGY